MTFAGFVLRSVKNFPLDDAVALPPLPSAKKAVMLVWLPGEVAATLLFFPAGLSVLIFPFLAA